MQGRRLPQRGVIPNLTREHLAPEQWPTAECAAEPRQLVSLLFDGYPGCDDREVQVEGEVGCRADDSLRRPLTGVECVGRVEPEEAPSGGVERLNAALNAAVAAQQQPHPVLPEQVGHVAAGQASRLRQLQYQR